jgi:uncharacterized protein (DUF305 family)
MEPVYRGTRGRVLFALSAVALIAISAASGYVLHRPEPSGFPPPGVTSVDAGFARDMATHHEQAISMAGYVRDRSTDPAISLWGFDIERSQNFQVGQLSGWLQAWGLSRTSDLPPMSWMASWMPMSGHTHSAANGMMPGMATPDEMTELQSLTGKALDIDFLQLMIRHHQGGVQMAAYAAEHATLAYVRDIARAMASGQRAEIIDMERDLRARGGVPLPFTM